MKKITVLLFSVILSMTAFAGNEGPQAVPRNHGKLVAESIVSIAFAPASVPSSIRYQIYSTGYTLVVKKMRDGSVTSSALRPFTLEEITAINNSIKAIIPGELYDPNPEAPGCYDTPYERKVVYNNDGEIQISRRAACKGSERLNATLDDVEVIKALNTLIYSEDK